MNIERLKEELLRNEDFKKEYERYDLGFEIGQSVIDARIKLNITQTELANMVGTKQSSIARLENGYHLPSLSFLEKIAEKIGTRLVAPKFAFLLVEQQIVSDGMIAGTENGYTTKITTAPNWAYSSYVSCFMGGHEVGYKSESSKSMSPSLALI